MQAIWQMVDAIIIPIMTYACERWTTNKEENKSLQCIFNEALKTLLFLPKGTPTTILLNETGKTPIKYTIKIKKILQATKRIDQMKEESLIRDATQAKASTQRKHVIGLAKELHIYDQMTILSKEALKHCTQKEIETKILEEIDNEAEIKTKIYHWKERKKEIKVETRPN